LQEISQHILSALGHKRFGVKLDTLHRVPAVPQPHNGVVISIGLYLKTDHRIPGDELLESFSAFTIC